MVRAAGAALAGCSAADSPDCAAHNENSGSVGLALDVSDGVRLETVSYTIVGPNSYSKSGSIKVKKPDAASLRAIVGLGFAGRPTAA